MKEKSRHDLRKQLKLTSAAIDLIKISQRTQHTSVKEALRKMLRSISMLAEIEIEEPTREDRKKVAKEELMKKAKEIRKNREKKEKEAKDVQSISTTNSTSDR